MTKLTGLQVKTRVVSDEGPTVQHSQNKADRATSKLHPVTGKRLTMTATLIGLQGRQSPVSDEGPTMTTQLIGLQVRKHLVSGEGLGGQVCWVAIQGDHAVQGSHMTPQPDVLQTSVYIIPYNIK